MRLILILAWRNIWRNKRRSVLTLVAISFATFSSIAMRGLQSGTYALNIENAVNLFSGYVQIQKKGYQTNPAINKSFGNINSIKREIYSVKGVKGLAARIYAEGLVCYKDNSFGASIFGIDPSDEKKVSSIISKINKGSFLINDSSNGIVIGCKLFDNLKAGLGDEIVILSQGADGSMGNLKFKITGTIKTGLSEMDNSGIYIGLKRADELLSMYGNVNAIAVSLNSFNELNNVKKDIRNKLSGANLDVLSWDEIMPDFKESIEFDNVSGILYLSILVIIVAFGILNTVLMSITERFNEFGIVLSIGMRQIDLAVMVLIETVFITLIGIAIGNIIGWGINSYIMGHPIEFAGTSAKIYEEYGLLPKIESSLLPSIFFNTSIIILISAIVSSIYPLYKVFKLEPLKGIRYT